MYYPYMSLCRVYPFDHQSKCTTMSCSMHWPIMWAKARKASQGWYFLRWKWLTLCNINQVYIYKYQILQKQSTLSVTIIYRVYSLVPALCNSFTSHMLLSLSHNLMSLSSITYSLYIHIYVCVCVCVMWYGCAFAFRFLLPSVILIKLYWVRHHFL